MDTNNYGNHSCSQCLSRFLCSAVPYMGDTFKPNDCSFYWPPNTKQRPSRKYWIALEQMAESLYEKSKEKNE